MKPKLILYTLDEGAEEANVLNYVKKHPKWAIPFPFAFIVLTEKTSGEVRDALREAISSKGKIMVIDITGRGWGTYAISKTVTSWMKENI